MSIEPNLQRNYQLHGLWCFYTSYNVSIWHVFIWSENLLSGLYILYVGTTLFRSTPLGLCTQDTIPKREALQEHDDKRGTLSLYEYEAQMELCFLGQWWWQLIFQQRFSDLGHSQDLKTWINIHWILQNAQYFKCYSHFIFKFCNVIETSFIYYLKHHPRLHFARKTAG